VCSPSLVQRRRENQTLGDLKECRPGLWAPMSGFIQRLKGKKSELTNHQSPLPVAPCVRIREERSHRNCSHPPLLRRSKRNIGRGCGGVKKQEIFMYLTTRLMAPRREGRNGWAAAPEYMGW